MSKEPRLSRKSKSRSRESNEKRKKVERSKLYDSLKEPNEMKLKNTDKITKNKIRNDNERINKKESQKLAKKDSKKTEQIKMIGLIGQDILESNSIDKSRTHSLFSSKISNHNSTANTTKQYGKQDSIKKKVEKLNDKRNIVENSPRKTDSRNWRNDKDDNTRIARSDNIYPVVVDNYSIDKIRRSATAMSGSRLNYQNLKSFKVSASEQFQLSKVSSQPKYSNEYSYEDDFENYDNDFEEETENDDDNNSNDEDDDEDNDKDGSSHDDSKAGRNQQSNEQNSGSSIASPIVVPSNPSLMDMKRDDSRIDSLLLRRIMSNRNRQSDNRTQEVPLQTIYYSNPKQRRIDFSSASIINPGKLFEAERRFKMLKNLIGMELIKFDLLDHHPIREYDFYVQMFGSTNHKQVQTQTGDDNLDCYIQTEETDNETVWTQVPYSDPQGWGTVNTSNGSDYRKNFITDDNEMKLFKMDYFQMDKLRKFISIAGQVFIDLMQSSNYNTMKPSLDYQKLSKFSKGYNKFSLGNIANSARISSIFHRDNYLFVAFYVEQASNEDIINRSLIVEFDICMSNFPQRIFLCDNEVRCFCMSPDSTSAIFAGLNDGSCMAYDLRESNSLFPNKLQWPENEELYPLRIAAYDTSFKAVINKISKDDCQFAIIAISEMPSDWNSSETYRLISVNEVGIVIIWTIINEEANQIIDHDLGLRPGAKLKMTQTSVLKPNSFLFSCLNSSQNTTVNCMTMVPTNPGQFLLGTNIGAVISFVPSKAIKLIGPRIYRNNFDMVAEVICICFSLDASFFLVAFSNGHISLHEISKIQPILNIESMESINQPLLRVLFSRTNSTKFYSIHKNGLIQIWDLAKSKKALESLDEMNIKDCTEVTTAQLWTCLSGNSLSELSAIGYSNGEVHLHSLSELSVKCDSKRGNESLSTAVKRLIKF